MPNSPPAPPIDLAPSRECGECVECCVLLAIDTLKKPARTICTHCSGRDCQIYDARPDVCREFFCLWRKLGAMCEAHRPDRLGVLFHVVRGQPTASILRRLYVVGIPLQPFPNYATPEIEAALEVLRARRVPVWLYFGDLLKCVHPDAMIQEALLSDMSPPDEKIASEIAAWRKILSKSSNT